MNYREAYDRINWTPLPPAPTKERVPVARGNFPVPMMIRDTISPVQSMADGRWHESKASLERSYRADGNPQGIEYQVLGNDQKPEVQKSAAKSKAEQQMSRRESIARAEAKVAAGEGVRLPD